MQSLTGRSITMARPDAREIDPITDLPEMLARITRFNGAVPGGILSVAQHCVMMADVVIEEVGDANLAALALLHDGHEYIWGNITTPQAEGLDEIAIELHGKNFAGVISAVIAEAKRRADAAIFRACGVPYPPTAEQVRAIKSYDLRMLATERRHLLITSNKRWGARIEQAKPLAMRGAIKLWPIAKAAEEYRDRLRRLCPAVARKSSR